MVFRAGLRDPCTRDVTRFSESVKVHEPQASVFLRFPKIELRLGKHRQSWVHKTYCFPRS